VLGPLLFLLYVNDIANAVSDQTIKLFAGDTNLFIASKYQLSRLIYDAINKLNIWFISNRLSLNLDITCYMVFPHRSESNIYFNVQIDGVTRNKVKSCGYLCLFIDDELKWT